MNRYMAFAGMFRGEFNKIVTVEANSVTEAGIKVAEYLLSQGRCEMYKFWLDCGGKLIDRNGRLARVE